MWYQFHTHILATPSRFVNIRQRKSCAQKCCTRQQMRVQHRIYMPSLFPAGLGKRLAERLAGLEILIRRPVLDGEAVRKELRARLPRALRPRLHPGTAAPAVGAEERDGHARELLFRRGEERLESAPSIRAC